MSNELVDIVRTWGRVEAGGYAIPTSVRLLEMLNDLLEPLAELDPLTELTGVGLTVMAWLGAIELRRYILVELDDLDLIELGT